VRLLVTGAGGMLGLDVLRAGERAGHELVGLAHAELDIADTAAVEKAFAERDANFKALRGALQQLAEARAELLAAAAVEEGGLRIVSEVLRDVHPELLLPLATELAKKERTVALLALEASGQLVFAQHASAGKDLAALLKQVFATFPGKGGGTRDFVRARLSEPSASAAAVGLARKLLLS